MIKQKIIFLLLFMCSCSTSINEQNLQLLNGYWEITEVEFTNGTKKEYKINSTVDYIMLDSLQGFRKKVTPKFNGTFETSDDAEPFVIRIKKDSVLLLYTTEMAQWQEQLIVLDQSTFSVRNEEGVIYHYKRFEPINITP